VCLICVGWEEINLSYVICCKQCQHHFAIPPIPPPTEEEKRQRQKSIEEQQKFRKDWRRNISKAQEKVDNYVKLGWKLHGTSTLVASDADSAERKLVKNNRNYKFKRIPCAKWYGKEVLFLLYKQVKKKIAPGISEPLAHILKSHYLRCRI